MKTFVNVSDPVLRISCMTFHLDLEDDWSKSVSLMFRGGERKKYDREFPTVAQILKRREGFQNLQAKPQFKPYGGSLVGFVKHPAVSDGEDE